MTETLDQLVAAVRSHPGVRNKAPIALVSDVLGPSDALRGPGDDGAVVRDGDVTMVVGGEALWPPFAQGDPFGAGVAAVLANVNDLVAMGARPLAIVDTIVGPEDLARRALEGMRYAAELYQVPIVGGHLTLRAGPPAISAFGLGRVGPADRAEPAGSAAPTGAVGPAGAAEADGRAAGPAVLARPPDPERSEPSLATGPLWAGRVLSVRRVEVGQSLIVACCIDGTMRDDFNFFRSFDERGDRLAGDIRVLPALAADGSCVAAKDISMAGLVGSLAMLLEFRRLGVTVDLGAVPRPDGVGLEAWLTTFPCFGFLLCSPQGNEEACMRPFWERDLAAAVVGMIDGSGLVRLRDQDDTATVFDLRAESVTGLRAG